MGNVLYYLDENGNKRDGRLHFDPEFMAFCAIEDAGAAIERNVGAGMSYDKAVSLFATPELKAALDRGAPLADAVEQVRKTLQVSFALAKTQKANSQ